MKTLIFTFEPHTSVRLDLEYDHFMRLTPTQCQEMCQDIAPENTKLGKLVQLTTHPFWGD